MLSNNNMLRDAHQFEDYIELSQMIQARMHQVIQLGWNIIRQVGHGNKVYCEYTHIICKTKEMVNEN